MYYNNALGCYRYHWSAYMQRWGQTHKVVLLAVNPNLVRSPHTRRDCRKPRFQLFRERGVEGCLRPAGVEAK